MSPHTHGGRRPPRAHRRGPTGGDLNDVENLKTVIASPDIVAADSYAATLFDLTGSDMPYVQAAYAMGLGEMDFDKVDIRRISA